MKQWLIGGLMVYAGVTWAVPQYLMTHNTTDVESNAFIDGTIPSLYPTKAHTDNKVYWNMVRLACHGHTNGDQCAALVKMNTHNGEAGSDSVEVGYLMLNLKTGEITPKQLSGNCYRLVVNGLGETTLSRE